VLGCQCIGTGIYIPQDVQEPEPLIIGGTREQEGIA